MPKTSAISARIDPELKHSAEQVFRELGLSTSQAITLFYKQVELRQGLPFAVRIPTEQTKQALDDARQRRNIETFDNAQALFDDLNIS